MTQFFFFWNLLGCCLRPFWSGVCGVVGAALGEESVLRFGQLGPQGLPNYVQVHGLRWRVETWWRLAGFGNLICCGGWLGFWETELVSIWAVVVV